MTTVKDIYDYIDSIAPFDTQEDWDNAGLLLGSADNEVKTVVLSLDASRRAAEFAAGIKADLLLTHHPAIFSGLKRIEEDSAVCTMLRGGVAHIAAHTNFDKSDCGINFNLASILSLENPVRIGDGFLVCGDLHTPMSIDDFARFAAELLDSRSPGYTDSQRLIKRVAVGGGACGEYVDVAAQNADCFLTGELKYHELLNASEVGFPVISAGHFETENKPFLMLGDMLRQQFGDVDFVKAPISAPVLGV